MVSSQWLLVVSQILMIISVAYSAPAIKNNETTGNGNDTTVDSNSNYNSEYNFEQFHEVYDQRQNGTDNYKVNVDGVALIWAPLGSLITAATLFDPNLLESEYPDLEDLFNPQNPEKPLDGVTTSSPRPGLFSRDASKKVDVDNVVNAKSEDEVDIPIKKISDNQKRKFRIPGFLRPLFRNRRVLVQRLE